jgi:hypothetical protein
MSLKNIFTKFETIKIDEFFLIIWQKWSELEPEPEFLPSWSRTKMDRLRNTAFGNRRFLSLSLAF